MSDAKCPPVYDEIPATISNYYGTPTIRVAKGDFYLYLDDYETVQEVQVSSAFAEAWRLEFAPHVDWNKE